MVKGLADIVWDFRLFGTMKAMVSNTRTEERNPGIIMVLGSGFGQ